ncbi:alpha-glucan family phosphorylase [Orenia marismortui]|uniref:alpha-glucan family phosphorylase n=1 Tax=Orenia marismortui TaxID=46469 RepID=UPI000362D372|nr:alpha-glucan family phosphorylase [Orenia marismortui]
MQFYGSISVNPELPVEIEGLKKLAENLWWSWNPEAEELFKRIDMNLWEEVEKNPIKLLSKVSYKTLQNLGKDKEFLRCYNKVMESFEKYLNRRDTWFNLNFDSLDDNRVIAYFSAEFALHESLPIYSGGLGVLAGDHCKSASDLGLPFVGVGLLYRNGYFRQEINEEGWQKSIYNDLDFKELVVNPVKDNDNDLVVSVRLEDRDVYLKVWEVKVGRVSLYLLDADLEVNNKVDRALTSRLYGGGPETRISQEIILGIGGTRALYKMGYQPVAWHMNEGHSVYLGLERIRDLIQDYDMNFYQAIEKVSANTVFTTHTPVPAGNEVFSFSLKDKYFSKYWNEIGISREEFMKLGKIHDYDEGFGLTVLALNLSSFHNGVSKLHGDVSSAMWKELWPGVPTDENPISYITNGVHTLTWLAPEWKNLLDKYLPENWRDRIVEQKMWKKVREIPNEEFWKVHKDLKAKMIDYIRKRDLIRRQRDSKINNLSKDSNLLNKNSLTIGFARRFATYKRATLILKDLKRLKKICNNQGQEVQFIFAGKAHPADIPGQELIKKLHNIAESEEFKGKIVILEDYDMNLARYLVQGVDVWLNTPRRPLEASGTSGQKVAANAGLNFSILDGWWCEGYNGKNGWTIGHKSEYSSSEEQDLIDSISLYKTLEEEIVPLYYDTDSNEIAEEWIARMKESMITNAPEYSTDRMVQEYTNNLYLPAIKRGKELDQDNCQLAIELADWKHKLKSNWDKIKIYSEQEGNQGSFSIKDEIELTAKVDLGQLLAEDVEVEVYLVNKLNESQTKIIPMEFQLEEDGIYNYIAKINFDETGIYNYTFRVLPSSKNLTHRHELGLIKWI